LRQPVRANLIRFRIGADGDVQAPVETHSARFVVKVGCFLVSMQREHSMDLPES
jgi:hypothetical protein